MKTDKNFRLSKTAKSMLALLTFKDAHERGEYKRLLIDAEFSAIRAKFAKLKEKEKTLDS